MFIIQNVRCIGISLNGKNGIPKLTSQGLKTRCFLKDSWGNKTIIG